MRMSQSGPPSYAHFHLTQQPAGQVTVFFRSNLNVDRAAEILSQLRDAFEAIEPHSLTVDLTQVDIIDDYGALILAELKNRVLGGRGRFQVVNARPRARHLLDIARFDPVAPSGTTVPDEYRNFFVRCGDAILERSFNLRYMVAFLGSVILALLHVLRRPRSLRIVDTLVFMEKTGVNALPIVTLISFLLGLVIAFMSSLQLNQFGANIYVASLVAIAMASELGPIMTAIVVAGRSGSAYAAEIGSMRISEEIDALFLMGFAPTLFLAVPRIVASVIVVPLLTLFADVCGMLGGLLVGVFLLDLTLSAYVSQTLKALSLFEVFWGLSKSVVFAALVAWIGCLRGFQTRGGADAVGNAATSAVVTSIFFIILIDSIFAVSRSYLW
jgi:phospholipid/cholesterol/gamma-HCH transport system permease protein